MPDIPSTALQCFSRAADRVAAGGGLHAEGEDIAVLHVDLDEALAMVGDGRITDGKTVILLQALMLWVARKQAKHYQAFHGCPLDLSGIFNDAQFRACSDS